MSIEQEINRNTMTIAELVKAVRELTEAIKGAGTAAAKAGTAVADFARMAATPSVVIDGVTDMPQDPQPGCITYGETRTFAGAPGSFQNMPKEPIEPDTRPFAEVVAEQVVEEAKPIEQGPFFWSHPESSSYGKVETRTELAALMAGEVCVDEVTAEEYAQLVAADTKPADENRYFHDTVHRAAYKIAPTEPLNGLQARAGVEEINAEQYAVLKAEYTKLTDQVIRAANTQVAKIGSKVADDMRSGRRGSSQPESQEVPDGEFPATQQDLRPGEVLFTSPNAVPIAGNAKTAPAAATAAPVDTPPSAPAAAAPSPTATSSEPPPSAPEPAASPAEAPVAEPTWPEVHATLMRLVKTAGCGAPQLIALLEDFGVKRPETALALQTKAVGRFAEIIANAERRMKGGAA